MRILTVSLVLQRLMPDCTRLLRPIIIIFILNSVKVETMITAFRLHIKTCYGNNIYTVRYFRFEPFRWCFNLGFLLDNSCECIRGFVQLPWNSHSSATQWKPCHGKHRIDFQSDFKMGYAFFILRVLYRKLRAWC